MDIVIKYKSLGIGHQHYEVDLFIESSELEVEYPKFNTCHLKVKLIQSLLLSLITTQ